MQNHGGYTVEDRAGFEPTVKLGYDTEYPLAETYLSLARESDSAFKELLEYFEKVDEPTMIVMFGAHWPKIEEEFMGKVKSIFPRAKAGKDGKTITLDFQEE